MGSKKSGPHTHKPRCISFTDKVCTRLCYDATDDELLGTCGKPECKRNVAEKMPEEGKKYAGYLLAGKRDKAALQAALAYRERIAKVQETAYKARLQVFNIVTSLYIVTSCCNVRFFQVYLDEIDKETADKLAVAAKSLNAAVVSDASAKIDEAVNEAGKARAEASTAFKRRGKRAFFQDSQDIEAASTGRARTDALQAAQAAQAAGDALANQAVLLIDRFHFASSSSSQQ